MAGFLQTGQPTGTDIRQFKTNQFSDIHTYCFRIPILDLDANSHSHTHIYTDPHSPTHAHTYAYSHSFTIRDLSPGWLDLSPARWEFLPDLG